MASFMKPQIILLKDDVDTSQGKGTVLSNITSIQAISDTIKGTLGPCGLDKLIIDANNKATISNDGATILKLLEIQHPAARSLVDIAKAQDAEIGDGTTSVVLLAAEFLSKIKPLLEEDISALEKIKQLSIQIPDADTKEFKELLVKCAMTTLASKLVHYHAKFFSELVVDSVLGLNKEGFLDLKLIGIKKVTGGGFQDSQLIKGVCFKKTFSYAGFEQQPKKFINPKVICLNIELELKAEKDNAEVRVDTVDEYQKVVKAEWDIIFDKLEKIYQTGAQIVLSKLPIGDLATQWFADRNVFCAGRVSNDDMTRVCEALNATIYSTVSNLPKPDENGLGSCELFEEKQVGSERFNFFTGCPLANSSTLLLRGGAEQLLDEVERSLHDAIMIVKRTVQYKSIVPGGGAMEMEVSKHLRESAKKEKGSIQHAMLAYAKALEVIPRQLCKNGGLDPTLILTQLRHIHAQPLGKYYGVNLNVKMENDKVEWVVDNYEHNVWMPAASVRNYLASSTEAACLVLGVDHVVINKPAPQSNGGMPPMGR